MSLWKRRIEKLLISLAIFMTGFTLAPATVSILLNNWMLTRNAESQQLKLRYGPSTNSEHEEEWILRDFFGTTRNGVFVDIGASDYRKFSNTFYLETELGWSGLAVDALKEFEADYVKHRPKTRFRSFFVSDRSNEQATMYFLKNNTLVTSSDKGFTQRYGKEVAEITTPTITLNDLLDKEGISTFQFMSMDIELAEPKALAGFDIERFRPRLVCIEDHPEVRQQILDYFAEHGYAVMGKYLRADTHNLYFAPYRDQ